MQSNMFDASGKSAAEQKPAVKKLYVPDYSQSPCTLLDHIVAFLIGAAAGFVVLFVFYKIVLLAIIGALAVGTVNIFVSEQNAIRKRRRQLRTQFFDMLEAMSVAMRAGNPVLKALESAKKDLAMIYPEDSDILLEIEIIIQKFHNAVPISKALEDFAQRSELEDIASFAAIYATIEGKSSRADEIIRETQQIIADKMEIEMEIETMMTSAKSEANIMLVMPLVILAVIGYAGGGFMAAIYKTPVGRIVATGGLVIFVVSYFLVKKFSDIEL